VAASAAHGSRIGKVGVLLLASYVIGLAEVRCDRFASVIRLIVRGQPGGQSHRVLSISLIY
jgi:hypothetical protein